MTVMDNAGQTNGSSTFDDLIQAGRTALAAGKPRLAHDLWREAARLQPYNEQVWLALFEVLETDLDRKVCLENIITINPLNVQARRQLNRLETHLQSEAQRQAEETVHRTLHRQFRRSLLRRAVLLGIFIGVSGILFGVFLSIVLYGL